MVNPQVTYEGPAYVHGLLSAEMRGHPISIERLRNGLWRVHYGKELFRTYDRDPRAGVRGEYRIAARPRSLNEAAHKVAA